MKDRYYKSEVTSYILFVLGKRAALLAYIAAGTFLTVIFFTYLTTPTWEATSVVLVERSSKQNLSIFKDMNLPVGGASESEKSNLNLVEILTGENMAYDIVREFGLDRENRRKRFEPKNLRERLKNLITDAILSPVILLQKVGVLESGEKNWADAAAEDFLEDWQDIEAEEGSGLIVLTINGERPRQAMDIANRMVEILVQRTQGFTRSGADSSHGFVAEQFAASERNLKDAEAALAAFKEKNSIVMVEEEKRLKLERLNALEGELQAAQKQGEETRTRLSEVNAELEKQQEKVILETVIAKNPVATELEGALQNLEIKLASALAEKKERHPDVLKMEAEIEKNKQALKSVVQEIVESQKESYNPIFQELLGRAIDLRTEAIALKAREGALRKNIAQIKGELDVLTEKESELARLQTLLNSSRGVYESLKTRLDELSIEKESRNNEYNIRVLDRAFVSDDADPDWPSWGLIIIGGFVMAMVFGLGGVFIAEYWNDSFFDARDIEADLHVPLLGSVPDFGERKRGLPALKEAVLGRFRR